jgi:hypothetical protein
MSPDATTNGPKPWKASMKGRAVFAPDAVAFMQSLPDNGKVTIRTTRSDGKVKEETFDLGAVSEVRRKDRPCVCLG